jgi:methyl-accepting chemotaxis protein
MEKAASELMDREVHFMKDSGAIGKQRLGTARLTAILMNLVAFVLVGIIAYVLRGTTNELRKLAIELGSGADQIESGTAEVSASSQSLAQSASEQAASLEETSAASEEIASMTRKNAEASKSAASLMEIVDCRVAEGNRALEEMVSSMHEITSSSNRISKIIKLIDEIAFQTNILALNAAVEAARAGEAGMGFGVVADEVRNLAQRSAQAARDTAELIEDSMSKSKEGGLRFQHVAEVIRTITESAGKVKLLVAEVNQGSHEQALGIEETSRSIARMQDLTQTTAASSEESASVSEEIAARAKGLHQIAEKLLVMVGGAA